MKKSYLSFLLGVFTGIVFVGMFSFLKRSPESENIQETKAPALLEAIGIPRTEIIIHRQGYSLGYDLKRKTANWVWEHLTSENLQSAQEKMLFKVHEDPEIPAPFRTQLGDYRSDEFEKAYLCPPMDRRNHLAAMADTYYLSNIVPQARKLKEGVWRELEQKVRAWTKEYQSLDVFTGPLFLASENQMNYRLIGPNQLAVPTAFYKVIFAKKKRDWDTKCYLIPNEALNEGIDQYEVSLEEIEKASGITFTRNLQ